MFFNWQLKNKLIPEVKYNPQKYFSWQKVKILTSSGIWNSVNQLSNILTTSVDLLLTNIFISASATGDFSIAKTVPSLLSHAVVMISGTFTSLFNIIYAKGHIKELVHEINKAMTICGFVGSVPVGYFMVNSDYFFKLWVPTAYETSIFWLSFISLAPSIFGFPTLPLFAIFTITNKRKVPAICLTIIGVLNIAIVFCLLKYTNLGVFAIALTSAVLLGLRNLLFTTIYGAMCLGLPKRTFFPVFAKSVVACLVALALSYAVRGLMFNLTWVTFILHLAFAALIGYTFNYFLLLDKTDREYVWNTIRKITGRWK